MHDKLRVYRRNGVREYVVWRTHEQRIDWFELADGEYRPLPPDDEGVIHSRVFPGLRLDAGALLNGDLAGALTELQKAPDLPNTANLSSGWPSERSLAALSAPNPMPPDTGVVILDR